MPYVRNAVPTAKIPISLVGRYGAAIDLVPQVAVSKDGGDFAAGVGALAKVAPGYWTYLPAQSETNCAVFAVRASALGQQTAVESFPTIARAPFDPAVDTVVASTVVDKAGYVLSAAGDADVGNAVWASSARTLTSFGSLAAQVASSVADALSGTLSPIKVVTDRLGTMIQDKGGGVYRFLSSALELASGGGSGSGILAYPPSNPVLPAQGASLALTKGTAYKAALNNAVSFRSAAWPSLSGRAVTLNQVVGGGLVAIASGTVTVDGANQVVTFDLTIANLSGLATGDAQEYRVMANFSPDALMLAKGRLSIRA